jgi:hypothetical protein
MQIEEQTGSSPVLEDEAIAASADVSTSDDKPGETEDSLLSVVQNVANPTAETSDGDAESPTADQSQSDTNEQPVADEAKDYSKLPFNTHPRFRDLVKEKNTYKAQLSEYESDAKQFREIQGFMQANGLSAEEVAQSLDMLAKMKKGDPTQAYETLRGQLDQLELATGKRLPPELEEKVDQGYIDRETAQELYRQQAEAERRAYAAQTQLERANQNDQRAQVTAMANAVSAWEQATKATDPDFELKAELVKDRVRAYVANHGVPRTAEDALRVSKEAYDTVTQTLLKVRGDKAPMRTTVGGKTNGSAAPEPKSLLEVIRRASAGA